MKTFNDLKSGELFRFHGSSRLYMKLHHRCVCCTTWRILTPSFARDYSRQVVSCGMALNNHLDLMICLKQLIGILESRCKAEGGEGLTGVALNEARKQIEIGKNHLGEDMLMSSYWSS